MSCGQQYCSTMGRLIFQLLQLSLCYRYGKQDSHECDHAHPKVYSKSPIPYSTYTSALNHEHTGVKIADFGGKSPNTIFKLLHGCCTFPTLLDTTYWIKNHGHGCRTLYIASNYVRVVDSQIGQCGENYFALIANNPDSYNCPTHAVTTRKPPSTHEQSPSTLTTSEKTVTSMDQTASGVSYINIQETTDVLTNAMHTSQLISTHTPTTVTMPTTTHDAMNTSSRKPTNPSTSLTPLSEWKTIDNREYYINRNNLSYSEADDECQRIEDAALTWYLVPDNFAGVVENLGLEPGFFWVGGAKSEVVNYGKALLLNINVQDGNRETLLTEASQEQRHYSLCSRIANIADVLNEPFFKKILEDMDMEAKSTSQAKRKLSSADNGDTSSKVLGSSFGIFLFTAILVSIIAMDIPRLFSCCRCGKSFSLRKKEFKITNSSDC